jgi:hypothetical protein
MKLAKFNKDQALIMQVIEEAGEEDVENLLLHLKFDRQQLVNHLISLQRKGIIQIKNTGYSTVARLSTKGRKTARLLWPDLPYINYS